MTARRFRGGQHLPHFSWTLRHCVSSIMLFQKGGVVGDVVGSGGSTGVVTCRARPTPPIQTSQTYFVGVRLHTSMRLGGGTCTGC